jgi:hypothetical protein
MDLDLGTPRFPVFDESGQHVGKLVVGHEPRAFDRDAAPSLQQIVNHFRWLSAVAIEVTRPWGTIPENPRVGLPIIYWRCRARLPLTVLIPQAEVHHGSIQGSSTILPPRPPASIRA